MDLGVIRKIQTDYFSYYDRFSSPDEIINTDFSLHNHACYEIYFFIEGDAKYIIEDKSYPLEPYDLFVIKKDELHQVFHNTPTPYRRVFIWVDHLFFKKHNCEIYEEKFLKLTSNPGSKIPAKIVQSSGIYDVLMRFKKYTNQYEDMNVPVLETLIVELLHLIHHASPLISATYTDNIIQPIITYLNQNYTHKISLDTLTSKFYISKSYLCRKFRETTGLSIHEYVQKKRLAKARELKAEGLSLGDVAAKSGFADYASFYRAYRKEFGCTPKDE